MRTDVKLGVVFALVMVLAAGGYFMFRGERQTPISLADKTAPTDIKTPPGKPGVPAKTAANQPKTPTTNNSRPPINPKPVVNNNAITPGRPGTPVANTNQANTTSQPVVPAPAAPNNTGSNPAMPRPATPMIVTPPPASPDASAALAKNPNPVPNTGSERPVNVPVNSQGTVPTTTPPTASPSTLADRPVAPAPAAPATGAEVGLTGIRNSVPAPTNPLSNHTAGNMTPLSNSPTGNVPGASPTSPSPATNALPPGIRTATSPKPDADSSKKSGSVDAAVERHKVQEGDSFSSLAQTYYGDSKYAKVLADANPKLGDPNHLKVGSLVSIPPLPADSDSRVAGAGASPALPKAGEKSSITPANGKRTYTVKAGDSFYSIAKSQLGSASRWKELLALNTAKVNGDPTSLQPGQSLLLPESH